MCEIKWCTSCGKWVARCVCKVTIANERPASVEVTQPVVIHIKPRNPAALAFGLKRTYGAGVRG